jgi:hypothetical protein
VKYDKSRKLDRNAALVAFKDANRNASWTAVGAQFMVSRQRAQAIYVATKRREVA